jgi:hypothetical protein
MKSLLIGIKQVLLWSYARGTWQYDVLCILIVATIFLIPSSFFGDRDRVAPKSDLITPTAVRANENAPVTSKAGTSDAGETIHIEIEKLRAFLERQNRAELLNSPREAIVLYLSNQLRRDVTIIGQEEPFTKNGQSGYLVRFK